MRNRILLFSLLICVSASSASAQRANTIPVMDNLVEATGPEARRSAFEGRMSNFESSPLANVPATNIGPAIMSGRVVDIDAHVADPSHFMVAYASGGLWVTWNNGQSFDPVFDHNGTMTIGDIAVDWETGTVWVGTGENNSSRSSYAGDGVYRSTDWGATWTHMGLTDTQRTGRIVLHPDNPDIVWVAAAGALYSPSEDRGVYMSTDAGASWQKTLFVDERTGAIDLVMDPTNPDILYAAMWERERRAWNFSESGPGSGIYKSIDGGRTWSRSDMNGFPRGEGVGRIGLAVHPTQPAIMYAALDNQFRKDDNDEKEEGNGLTRAQLRGMSQQEFLDQEEADIAAYLERENFPERYSIEVVTKMVADNVITPEALVDFVDDANAQLFDSPVIGLEVYRSDDAGASWTRSHEEDLPGVYNTYGYYFGEVRVAPDNPDQVYAMGVPIIRSDDGGQTWTSISESHVHSDHQALWMNPSRPGHIINGNDGGLNLSYDAGETWSKLNVPPVGQFYSVQVDMAEPYNVYGGLQDNGTWMGPSTYSASYRWYASGDYPYEAIGGGDGMQVQVDTRTNDVLYVGSQFGFYGRQNRTTGERISIRPRHELGEKPLRFNWQTPILLSPHNQDIFYYGANRLYRSMDQGANLQPISPDLTGGGQAGDVPYGTLTTISESPLRFGLIYTGSDDGYVQVTKDGGVSWNRIDAGLPDNLWVSRVVASSHVEGRVYATLNGYRWDHFDAYVYRSEDFGSTWTRIGSDLPNEPVNVIVEHSDNEHLLIVGTDHATYASLDGGASFHGLASEIPFVPVHDLKIQSRENELVVGTHGRSIWRIDLDPVSALDTELMAASIHVFAANEVIHSTAWGSKRSPYSDVSEPTTMLTIWSASAGSATIQIEAAEGDIVQSMEQEMVSGLNFIDYDMSVSESGASSFEEEPEVKGNGNRYLPSGTYTVRLLSNGAESNTELQIVDRRGGGRGGEPSSAPDPIYGLKK